jgi:hypothetical protein
MLRFDQAFSVELTLAVFMALVLIGVRIIRTVRRGRRPGIGWYVGALILLFVLTAILFLTVKAGSQHPPVVTPVPWP